MVRRFAIGIVFSLIPFGVLADAYDTAIGQVAAAHSIGTACPRLGLIGGSEQAFVNAAAEVLKTEGLRPNRFKKFYYYGQSDWIAQMQATALAARGIDGANQNALCAFGRKVAGTGDAIGRFLTRD